MYEQAKPLANLVQPEVTEILNMDDSELESVFGGDSRTTVPSHVPDIIMVDQTQE